MIMILISKLLKLDGAFLFISFKCKKVVNNGARKPVFGVSDQVRHKPYSTATEYGQRLEFSDLGSTAIVLSM